MGARLGPRFFLVGGWPPSTSIASVSATDSDDEGPECGSILSSANDSSGRMPAMAFARLVLGGTATSTAAAEARRSFSRSLSAFLSRFGLVGGAAGSAEREGAGGGVRCGFTEAYS